MTDKSATRPTLLFGGSFDPVHLGHVALAQAGMAQLNAKSLVVLPAGNPYQKGRAPLASGADRAAMLRLAFAATVDERELQRTGPTFTVTTLEELRRERATDESLIWLIGADAFAKLDSWHRWQELFLFANFAVIARADGVVMARSEALNDELAARETTIQNLHIYPAGAWATLATIPPPISSTDIRAKLAQHLSARGLVPNAVCDYIEQHHLYQEQHPNNG